jgi:hypothetical protein
MRHQMENRVIASAKPAQSIDGAQQALNQRPRQREAAAHPGRRVARQSCRAASALRPARSRSEETHGDERECVAGSAASSAAPRGPRTVPRPAPTDPGAAQPDKACARGPAGRGQATHLNSTPLPTSVHHAAFDIYRRRSPRSGRSAPFSGATTLEATAVHPGRREDYLVVTVTLAVTGLPSTITGV